MLIEHRPLRRLLRYDRKTGEFFWRMTKSGKAPIGTVAGCEQKAKRSPPYWVIRIDGRRYSRARLAFFWVTGRWPIEIDHRDGDSLNDAWKNLREATRSQNEANRGARRNNKLGVRGVRFQHNRYMAAIHRNGVRKHLGCFKTAGEAQAAYSVEARRLDGAFFREA